MLSGTLQILLFFAILLLTVVPLGKYMHGVFTGSTRFLAFLERPIYAILGVKEEDDQPWTHYAGSLLMFSVLGMLITYALLRLQGHLPMNPGGLNGTQMPPHLAFNTAASFTTNTNWQSYSPDVTLSNFSNMVALAIHNWASAAAGLSTLR